MKVSIFDYFLVSCKDWIEKISSTRLKFPFIPNLLSVVLRKDCWIFSNAFCAVKMLFNWDDHVDFFPFILLMKHITLVRFHMLNHPFISGMNSTWSWYVILLICCWILLTGILLKIFALMFIRILVCSFLGISCLIWYHGNTGII